MAPKAKPKAEAKATKGSSGYPEAAGKTPTGGSAAKAQAKKSGGAGAGAAGKAGGSGQEQKAGKKQDRAAAEAARVSQRDAMLNPSDEESSDSDAGAFGGGGGGAEKTAEKARLAAQQKEAEDALRREAAERRAARQMELAQEKEEKERAKQELVAARMAARAAKAQGANTDGAEEENADPEGSDKVAKDPLAIVLKKVEAGGKLSNKEQRLYDRHKQKLAEEREERDRAQALAAKGPSLARWEEELRDFSVSMADGGAPTDGARDAHLDQFSIGAGGVRLLEDASLVLVGGRHYGLLGPNGQGKTTLLKFLASRRLPTPSQWSVTLVEQEVAASSESVVDTVLAADMNRSRLLAEEESLLLKLEGGEDADSCAALCERLSTVGDELEASGAEAAEAKVRKILCGLGFTEEMMDGPTEVLSGGWRMRVSLAQALLLEPDLLLLDEPTNHLDLDAVVWLDTYLSEYKKTLLVVSHDADFLDSVCTDIIHLEDKKLQQYKGAYTSFTKAHAQHMKEREAAYKKQLEEKAKAAAKKKASKVVEEPLTKPKDYIVKFAFLPPRDDDEMVGISVHDVAFSYTGKKPWLLKGLNFRVDTSSRIAVVGPNGAGKSTLLSLVAKVVEPCEGQVDHSRRVAIGRYSQHFDEIAPHLHMSAVEFLTSSELRRFGAGTSNPELAHKCLGQFGLPSHGHTRPMQELSGGQKARVCFASITCRAPHVLILDEPTNHLDIESVEALIGALRKYQGGLLLVSHDARLIQAADCELWVCRGPGQTVEKSPSFEHYRKEVLRAMEKRQAAAEAQAKRRIEERRKRRQGAMALRGRRSG